MEQQKGLCGFTLDRSACCGSDMSTETLNMRLSITSTTGSPVELTVPRGETVHGLRTLISQKLRMQTDRIVLLHKDRQLTAGRLLDLGVTDGSKLTLVPVVEAGLVCSTARAERSLMDVLEGLTEVQIRDFLSGRSPLTLNLGIGAHVMYVQLQLSEKNVAELQKQHQYHLDLGAGSRKGFQTGVPTAAGMSTPGDHQAASWASTNTSRPTTPPASNSFTPAPNSSLPSEMTQMDSHRTRTTLNSTAPSSHSSSSASVNCHHHHSSPHQPCPPHTPRSSSAVMSSPVLPPSCPHPSSPLEAATPFCTPAPTGSNPGPPSPVTAPTFNECNIQARSPDERFKQPGAVIESFVSHSPGVFSGTFSGTLAPCSQSSVTHPRGGIAIILQILNDLLRAAFEHQGAPPAPLQPNSAASNPPVSSLLAAEQQIKAKSKALESQRTEQLRKTPDEERTPHPAPTHENQALHYKLERLQFLMQQRRTRRKSHLSQTSYPYQLRHHHP